MILCSLKDKFALVYVGNMHVTCKIRFKKELKSGLEFQENYIIIKVLFIKNP